MPKIIENLSQKLISEARKQTTEVGYNALNIRKVAKNCGVGVGTVYNYFPSKDALVAGFMLEDWMECLDRIKSLTAGRVDVEAVLEAIYRELNYFLSRYCDLFRSASESISAPPKQYHIILRSQLSNLIRAFCTDEFTADFISESIITWTVEGKSFSQIMNVIKKILY